MEIFKERNSENTFLPSWVRYSHQALYDFASKHVAGKKALDCACGTGIGAEKFIKAGASSLTGVDFSQEAVEICQRKIQGVNSQFMVGDAAKLPFRDEEFDVYISLETIEHIANDQAYLNEAWRVIKSGGIFVCSTPNRKVLNPGKTLDEKPLNKFHVREYSDEEFFKLLSLRFGNITKYGVAQNSCGKTKILDSLARLTSKRLAARLVQVLKLPKLIFDKREEYIVEPVDNNQCYEIMLAVCTKNK